MLGMADTGKEKEYLTVQQAARYLGISAQTLRRWIAKENSSRSVIPATTTAITSERTWSLCVSNINGPSRPISETFLPVHRGHRKQRPTS